MQLSDVNRSRRRVHEAFVSALLTRFGEVDREHLERVYAAAEDEVHAWMERLPRARHVAQLLYFGPREARALAS